ncbi:hypothetical protein [Amycolatopsis sp. NPDC051102]|uniref:hypothetical protein n=1 Tax=Amycolatopsis sp. NPDC051102 TaxID=3155163 RepID=UPI0034157AE3
MSVHLVGRQGHTTRSRGGFRLTPFGGVSIEPVCPPQPQAGEQVISQAEFDQLMLLMPDLDPDVVKKIMGVAVCSESTS